MSTPTERQRETMRLQMRDRRARLDAAGLCRMCGERPPRFNRVHCDGCADKRKSWDAGHIDARRTYQQRRRAELAAAGLCARCGREPPRPDLQTCINCKEVILVGRLRAEDLAGPARLTEDDKKIRDAGRCAVCASLLLPRHDCPGAPATAADLALGRRGEPQGHVSARRG